MVIVAKPRPKRERKGGKLDLTRAPGSDVSRQSDERRLQSLRRSLDDDIKRLKSALKNDRTDRVFALCDMISRKRGDAAGIASRLANNLSLDPIPAPSVTVRPSNRLVKKVKRYATWSDK